MAMAPYPEYCRALPAPTAKELQPAPPVGNHQLRKLSNEVRTRSDSGPLLDSHRDVSFIKSLLSDPEWLGPYLKQRSDDAIYFSALQPIQFHELLAVKLFPVEAQLISKFTGIHIATYENLRELFELLMFYQEFIFIHLEDREDCLQTIVLSTGDAAVVINLEVFKDSKLSTHLFRDPWHINKFLKDQITLLISDPKITKVCLNKWKLQVEFHVLLQEDHLHIQSCLQIYDYKYFNKAYNAEKPTMEIIAQRYLGIQIPR